MTKEQEVGVTETEEEEESFGPGRYVHTLRTPFKWEGRSFEKLSFDFTTLTGRDSIAISEELAAKGITTLMKEMDIHYQEAVAARACLDKVGTDMLERLPMPDFNKICNRARSFMLGLG